MLDHKQSKPLKDAELISIFPEAKEIIPRKLRELEDERCVLGGTIQTKLAAINSYPDEMSRWFWWQWLKLNEGADLISVDRNMARLRRQLRAIEGVSAPSGALTDELIQAARDIQIEDILNQEFRRRGSTLIGLCPFHDERTPSFHIYQNKNRGWCFGCNQGGDVISIVMKLHDCDFREAVLQLAGRQS